MGSDIGHELLKSIHPLQQCPQLAGQMGQYIAEKETGTNQCTT